MLIPCHHVNVIIYLAELLEVAVVAVVAAVVAVDWELRYQRQVQGMYKSRQCHVLNRTASGVRFVQHERDNFCYLTRQHLRQQKGR